MQKKLLLDGCSFTYGLNSAPHETLAHHFIECGYEVLNLSRPGKSNHAIALDVYNNLEYCDVVVVGWTYSSRWHLKYHEFDIDLLASKLQVELPHLIDTETIEQNYQELHRSLYGLFDITHWNRTSNMLVDLTHAMITAHQKRSVFFSLEPRKVMCPIYIPHVPSNHRLPCGHLNSNGTTHLFNNLTLLLEQ